MILAFHEAEIFNTFDLINCFPTKYEKFDLIKPDFLVHDLIITLKAKISSTAQTRFKGTFVITTFNFKVLEEEYSALAFNQQYLSKMLKIGSVVYLKGKYNDLKKTIIVNKVITEENFKLIKPIYNIKGIYDLSISKILKFIITNKLVEIKENLPIAILKKYNLENKMDVIIKAHFPKNEADLIKSRRRLKYEEAYFFQKEINNRFIIPKFRKPIKYDLNVIKKIIAKIPYNLTFEQKRIVNDIFKDFKDNKISYRLIQGDVGSGKTVVAMLAISGVVSAKMQAVLMVPTEILANQHYETIKKILGEEFKVELLTGSQKKKEEIKKNIKNGLVDIIIATHAVIQKEVEFKNLGLIVVDEQHKFGVNARSMLINKSLSGDVLYLSATPIPRTLAISLLGDIKISQIRQKPNKGVLVETKVINDENLNIIYEEIKKSLKAYQKVYVVAPAITSNHAKYNILNVEELIRKNFPKENIFILHGKLKKESQESILQNFITAKSAILIATSMIEVGINILNATLMIVFSANFFGLSQLHQLRGRVGRGTLKSKCFFITSGEIDEKLKKIENINDGFQLSREDLILRGPGNLLGSMQSGLMKFKFIDYFEDYEILREMRNEIVTKLWYNK